MKTQQHLHFRKALAMLLTVLLVTNLAIFTETSLSGPAYAAPVISEMNVNTTDNEVSVCGTGTTNVSGSGLAEKPYRYSIDSSQSDWVRDSSGVTINETLTSGALGNTQVACNSLTLVQDTVSESSVGVATGGGLEGYAYRKKLVIDHTKVDSELTNFPATVYLNNTNFDFSKAKPDGSDIRFTDKDLNPLKFERINHYGGPTENLELYTLGDEKAAVTGGWTGAARYGTYTKNANNLYNSCSQADSSYSHFVTNNKIDVTGYSKLWIDGAGSGYYWMVYLGTKNDDTDYYSYERYNAKWIGNRAYIDVSDLKGSYYVYIYAGGAGTANRSTGSLTINKIWLEPFSASHFAKYNVLLPKVSNLTDTEFYMWNGNPNAHNTSIEAWQDQTGKQLTYNGNVCLKVDAAKLGKDAYFDGTGDYFALNGGSDFAFSTGDFCLEFIYMTTVSGTDQKLYDARPVSTEGSYITLGKNSSNVLFFYTSGATRITGTKTINANTVYRIKLKRSNGVTQLFVDDVQDGSSYADTNNYLNSSSRPIIGASGYLLNDTCLNGVIKGMRITKGRSRTGASIPDILNVDGSDVVFCTNFDTIYDQNYAMVQHMGDTLVDATGNGNNGTAIGTTIVNTDYGKARSFNGTSDVISIPSFDIQNATILVMMNTNVNAQKRLISKYPGTGDQNGSICLQIYNLQVYFSIGINSTAYIANTSKALTTGNFYVVGGRYDGSVVASFLDAVKAQVSANYGNIPSYSHVWGIGEEIPYGSTPEYFDGIIAESRISSIARSDAWIKAESLSLKNQLISYSNYAPTGYRESGIYDISGCVNSSKVEWTQNTPTGTSIKVETNVSLDGGSTWQGWKPCSNGGIIVDLENGVDTSNARLKLRQTLTTSSCAITPSLSNSAITIGFGKYAMRATALPNTEHTVVFEVKDADGVITTKSETVCTKAQTPQFTVSSSTISAVTLTFSDANPENTEYQIMCNDMYVNSSGVRTSVPEWITLKDKKMEIIGLNIGTNYNFTAKTRNKVGEETNYASTINAGTQGIPVPSGNAQMAWTIHNNSIIISWKPISNALSYELEVDGITKKGIREFKKIDGTYYYIHEGLMTGTQHTYRVRGKNLGGYSEWTNLETLTTTSNLPLIPTDVLAKASKDSVTVYWKTAQEAERYIVEIGGTEITDVTRNSACLFGLEPNKAYTYRVRSSNVIGLSEWTTQGSITTYTLDTPKISKEETESNEIKIGWKKVEGATSYRIALDSNMNFETLEGTELDAFASSAAITYIHGNLPIKTAHVYRICAVGPTGSSAWSDPITLETLPQRPGMPANFRGSSSNEVIKLIWDAVQDAIGYDVEVDGIVVETESEPHYDYNGLSQYTEHTFRVRAVTNEIEGLWSKLLTIGTQGGVPDVPKNLVITNSRGIATLDWDKTDGAQSYDVEAGGGTYRNIPRDCFTHRMVELATSGGSIYKETAYRLKAVNDIGESEWSDTYVNNAIKGKIEKGKELELALTASNIQDFSGYLLNVTYNKDALTVTDLCAYSIEKELTPGMVEGQDIEIVSFTPGHITFKVNKVIEEGYLWKGIIENIKFVGNATGGTTLSYTVQCFED